MKWTRWAFNCSCATFEISAFGSPKCLKTARRRHSLRFENSSTSCSDRRTKTVSTCTLANSHHVSSSHSMHSRHSLYFLQCDFNRGIAVVWCTCPCLYQLPKSPRSDTYPRKLRLPRCDALRHIVCNMFKPIKALKEKKLKKKCQLFEQKKKIQQKVQRSHLATENSLAVKNITHNAGFPSLPALPLSW